MAQPQNVGDKHRHGHECAYLQYSGPLQQHYSFWFSCPQLTTPYSNRKNLSGCGTVMAQNNRSILHVPCAAEGYTCYSGPLQYQSHFSFFYL